MFRPRALVASILTLSLGCATVQRGPMQRVFIETDPPGAVVELTRCGTEAEERTTPVTIFVPRRVKRCSVLLFREGYEPARVMLERRPAPQVATAVEVFDAVLSESDSLGEFFGLALLGGMVYGLGKGVDAVAGSNYELQPRHVHVELIPTRSNENPQLLELP